MGAAITADGVTAWSVQAITDTYVVYSTVPGATLTLESRLCPGMYGSLSFCLRSTGEAVIAVSAANGDLPEPQVDLKYVKVWWQNKVYTGLSQNPGSVPELLLHNRELITAGTIGSPTNVLESPGTDEATIQSTTLEANWTQQYWVTIYVPPTAVAGDYDITISVTKGGDACMTFDVTVTVLDFTLSASPIKYGMYHITTRGYHPTAGVQASAALYAVELADMAAHGITRPICWEDFAAGFPAPDGTGPIGSDEKADGDLIKGYLQTILAARTAAGISNNPFFIGRMSVEWWDLEDLAEWKTRLSYAMSWLTAQDASITEFYLMGQDEADAAAMAIQQPLLAGIQTLGVKTAMTCSEISVANLAPYISNIDLMLNNVVGYDLSPWAAKETGMYGPTTREQPESYYRRRYGFPLLKAGWDHCYPYAYFYQSGASRWHDYDAVGSPSYKEHAMVYPTDSDTVLGTVQWEAMREAINDVRFAQTLIDLGGQCPTAGDDLDVTRDAVIDDIITLRRGCLILA